MRFSIALGVMCERREDWGGEEVKGRGVWTRLGLIPLVIQLSLYDERFLRGLEKDDGIDGWYISRYYTFLFFLMRFLSSV